MSKSGSRLSHWRRISRRTRKSSACRKLKPTKELPGGTEGRPRNDARPCDRRRSDGAGVLVAELAARHWKEEAQGAVITPDEVVLNYSPPEGSAVLKISRKYDLAIATIVQQVPVAAPKAMPALPSGSGLGERRPIDAMMRQAPQMVRDATARDA